MTAVLKVHQKELVKNTKFYRRIEPHGLWMIRMQRVGRKPTGLGPKFWKFRTGPDQNKANFEYLGPNHTERTPGVLQNFGPRPTKFLKSRTRSEQRKFENLYKLIIECKL